MTTGNSPEFEARRGTNIFGRFGSKALKNMAQDGRLLPTDEISADGRVWHAASNVKGLVFGSRLQASLTPPPLPDPKAATQFAVSGKADAAASTSPQTTAFTNPVSVLLNSLVTDKLSSLQQTVQQGFLSPGAFEAIGKGLLLQLQEAVAYLESLPRTFPQEKGGASTGVGVSNPATVPPRRRESQRSESGSPNSIPIAQASVAPATSSGLGSIAAVAGAAVLGGAFGYLLANQSRGHSGYYGINHPYQGLGGAYGSTFFASDATGQSGFASTDSEPTVTGFDADGDGRPETFVADTDGDHLADMRATDDDGDGLIDSFETDLDHDGNFDQRFVSDPINDRPLGDSENTQFVSSEIDSLDPIDEDIDDGLADLEYEADFDSGGFDTFDDVDFGE